MSAGDLNPPLRLKIGGLKPSGQVGDLGRSVTLTEQMVSGGTPKLPPGAFSSLMPEETRKTILEEIVSGNKPEFFAGTLASAMPEETRQALLEQMVAAGKTIARDLPKFTSKDMSGLIAAEHLKGNSLGEAFAEQRRSLLESLDQAIRSARRPPAEMELPAEQPKKAKRRVKRVSAEVQIAQRVLKRHRKEVVKFFKRADLKGELKELADIEARLTRGDKRSCKHAAFGARSMLEEVADRLFPPTSKKRKGRDRKVHSLGAKAFKNRLIAYAETSLRGKWERHEFQSFVSNMDSIFRWAGSGPHGIYTREEAERMYTLMLDALTVLARAFSAASQS